MTEEMDNYRLKLQQLNKNDINQDITSLEAVLGRLIVSATTIDKKGQTINKNLDELHRDRDLALTLLLKRKEEQKINLLEEQAYKMAINNVFGQYIHEEWLKENDKITKRHDIYIKSIKKAGFNTNLLVALGSAVLLSIPAAFAGSVIDYNLERKPSFGFKYFLEQYSAMAIAMQIRIPEVLQLVFNTGITMLGTGFAAKVEPFKEGYRKLIAQTITSLCEPELTKEQQLCESAPLGQSEYLLYLQEKMNNALRQREILRLENPNLGFQDYPDLTKEQLNIVNLLHYSINGNSTSEYNKTMEYLNNHQGIIPSVYRYIDETENYNGQKIVCGKLVYKSEKDLEQEKEQTIKLVKKESKKHKVADLYDHYLELSRNIKQTKENQVEILPVIYEEQGRSK